MPYSAYKIANEFLISHADDGIDPLKLQKLIYFANGWWLALKGKSLVSESPQVWRNGPVFPSVYRIFSHYRWNSIKAPDVSPFGSTPSRVDGDDQREVVNFLEWVWTQYGGQTGVELSEETHKEGTPWRNIAEEKRFKVRENTIIPAADDWKFFASLARERGYQVAQLANS